MLTSELNLITGKLNQAVVTKLIVAFDWMWENLEFP